MTEISSETRFLHAVEMGLGAWQWGDRVVWQYGHGYSEAQVREAFQVAIAEGIRFIDTAEIYGNGLSERLLGGFLQETDQPVLIATKFFPWPWRFTRGAIPKALKGSLARLKVESIDLYQIHWPNPVMGTDRVMQGLAECVKSGMTRTVGVSNFGQSRMLAAYFLPGAARRPAGFQPGALQPAQAGSGKGWDARPLQGAGHSPDRL